MDQRLMVVLISLGIIIVVTIAGYFGIKYRLWLLRKWNAPFRYSINPNKPLTQTPGKLVRKKIDRKSDQKAIIQLQNYKHFNMQDNPNLIRYYLTFETFTGYKSFTVTKEVYQQYKINKYGIIRHQKSKFHSFTYRSKQDIMALKNTT
jgi:hypothetical protein